MINKIGATGVIRPFEPSISRAQAVDAQREEVTDRVEFSALAVLRAKYCDMPEVRGNLVARIREQIKAGTYETPERWDQAIDNLMEDLDKPL
jgi:negative regulator of flagellin synthesis FlgM